jgi:hypothetical protein
MTDHKLTALDLLIIQDTIYQSLRISNYSGRGTVEGRQHVLEKICDIMSSMNVEVLTDTPDATTITADTGI